MSTIVIMPGGFHPFHAGHADLYQQAKKAFPGADIYVAATNDQSERPFPFALKEKLAKLAGVESGHFVQVKSPFQAKEITQHYNPEQDVLIFVRSEKDRNEPPKPGGTKKDGSPAYFQPYTGKDLQPFSQHAYIDYLKTVEFGPGITSATQIRNAWPTLDDRRKTAMVMSLYPAAQKNLKLAQNVVGMFDQVMGGQEGVAEGQNMPDANGNYKFHMFAYLRNGDIKEFNVIANGDRNAKILAKKKLIEKGYNNIYSIDIQGMSPVHGPVNYAIDRRLKLEQQGVAEGSSLGYTVIVRGNDFSYSRLKDALSDGHPSPAKVYKNGKFLGTIGSLSNQGVTEGLSKRDQQDVAAIRAVIERLQAQLSHPNADRDAIQQSIAHEKKRLALYNVAEGAPIVVAQAPIHIRNPKKAPQPYRNQGDIVPPTQPPSTEKRGVKGRAGQRPMPDYNKVSEGFGINYPSTYDQENANFRSRSQRRVGTLTTENIDPELINVLQYAQQHYPNSRNKQEAFMKFVQRALGHSRSDDERQDNELERLDKEVDQLQKKVNMSESTDYLEEK